MFTEVTALSRCMQQKDKIILGAEAWAADRAELLAATTKSSENGALRNMTGRETGCEVGNKLGSRLTRLPHKSLDQFVSENYPLKGTYRERCL